MQTLECQIEEFIGLRKFVLEDFIVNKQVASSTSLS
jgi:hypothetical protein